MRKLLLIPAMLFTLSYSADLAQAFDVKNKVIISGLGGLAIPVGDFSSENTANVEAGGAELGYNLGLAVEYGLSDVIQIGGRFSFDRFVIDEVFLYHTLFDTSFADTAVVDGHWSVVQYFGVYAKALLLPGKNTRPFGRAGLFFGRPKLTIDGAESAWPGEYDASLGLEAALGVTHMVSPQFGIGLDARFAHLFVNEDDSIVTLDNQNLSADAASPLGVRDPGGNSKYLILDGFISYHF